MSKLDLVGVGEISDLMKVSRARVHQIYTKRLNGFPPPAAALRAGPVWLRSDVTDWISERRRRRDRVERVS